MYAEDELLPLSAVAHFHFCARRAALVHIERLWAENRLTAEGRRLHERVHEQGGETRGDVRSARALPLRSRRLGLCGVADVVEFHRAAEGVELPGVRGRWQPFPVEYKRGAQRHELAFEVQLCAQALCLEEMLGAPVPAGALFYGASRRRQDIAFDAALRQTTEDAAKALHALIAAGRTPAAEYGEKCERCSLLELCLPRAAAGGRSATNYLRSEISDLRSARETDR